jgi:hypothetical protein
LHFFEDHPPSQMFQYSFDKDSGWRGGQPTALDAALTAFSTDESARHNVVWVWHFRPKPGYAGVGTFTGEPQAFTREWVESQHGREGA